MHQGVSDNDSVKRIQAAKQDLAQLFEKIDGVQERAKQTESSITEMTADIKRLDNTKCNLTLSMTALKRLQMLTAAYEQLQGLSSTRQYRECAQLLQAVIQLMAHFKSYRSIDQIATLGRNVSDVQRILLEQVCEDFELTFAKCEVAQKRAMLAEACLVMDALGDNARSRLITWYCNTQLREYRQVFRGNDEAGSLDNISRRYAWFKRMLKNYEEYHAAIFPAYWRVDEILANTFCEGTRDDFRGILAKYGRRGDGQVLDVNLLLTCLQETIEFEHSLERKFSNTSRLSIDTFASADEKPQPFSHAISEAFEPYLSVWVDAQDKELSAMIPKYRSRPTKPQEEDFSPQMVIQSSTELFNFYRQTLAQSAKLSTGASLVELAKVFAKCLDQYAQQVLLYNISEKPSGTTPSRVPSTQDIILVLNTANYCYLTCNQLEEKMKSRIDEAHRDAVDLQSQADAFMGIVSAAIRSLVRKIEVKLEPSWREMRNVNWAKIQNVMDQSTYVAEVERIIKSEAADIVHMLHKQQYARAFCDNLVDQFANSFLANIAQCKPIAEVGAEQVSPSVAITVCVADWHRCFSTLKPSTGPSMTSSWPTPQLPAPPLLDTLSVSRKPSLAPRHFSRPSRSAPLLLSHLSRHTWCTLQTNRTRTFARSWSSKASAVQTKPISLNCSRRTGRRPSMRRCRRTRRGSLRSQCQALVAAPPLSVSAARQAWSALLQAVRLEL